MFEQNNEFLLKIHMFRLTSCTLFLEVNEISYDNYKKKKKKVVGIDMVWTININGNVLKKFSKKEYHTLAPKVKLITMNLLIQKIKNDLEDHIGYFDTLNEMDITHLNIYDFF